MSGRVRVDMVIQRCSDCHNAYVQHANAKSFWAPTNSVSGLQVAGSVTLIAGQEPLHNTWTDTKESHAMLAAAAGCVVKPGSSGCTSATAKRATYPRVLGERAPLFWKAEQLCQAPNTE
jgi:hypothetical protein